MSFGSKVSTAFAAVAMTVAGWTGMFTPQAKAQSTPSSSATVSADDQKILTTYTQFVQAQQAGTVPNPGTIADQDITNIINANFTGEVSLTLGIISESNTVHRVVIDFPDAWTAYSVMTQFGETTVIPNMPQVKFKFGEMLDKVYANKLNGDDTATVKLNGTTIYSNMVFPVLIRTAVTANGAPVGPEVLYVETNQSSGDTWLRSIVAKNHAQAEELMDTLKGFVSAMLTIQQATGIITDAQLGNVGDSTNQTEEAAKHRRAVRSVVFMSSGTGSTSSYVLGGGK